MLPAVPRGEQPLGQVRRVLPRCGCRGVAGGVRDKKKKKKVMRVPLRLYLYRCGARFVAGAGGISREEDKEHPSEGRGMNPRLSGARSFGQKIRSSVEGTCGGKGGGTIAKGHMPA